MILDKIINAERYTGMHPLFPKVFEYIRTTDLFTLTSGKHCIQDDELFSIVERVKGRTRDAAQLETHRRYIDIQLILNGVDEMGWKPLADCKKPVSNYNGETDIQFFYDTPYSWITTPPEAFCIFFPEDAHAPLVSLEYIHKIVFKIAVNSTIS